MIPCRGCGFPLKKPGLCAQCKTANSASRARPFQHLYDEEWRRQARAFLRAHPMCVCEECKGERLPSKVVDHKIPHKGDRNLFWNPENWQALSKPCHDRKTAKEDGGFGNMNELPVLAFIAPEDAELPSCKPGEIFTLWKEMGGRDIPISVELVKIEGRKVYFRNLPQRN